VSMRGFSGRAGKKNTRVESNANMADDAVAPSVTLHSTCELRDGLQQLFPDIKINADSDIDNTKEFKDIIIHFPDIPDELDMYRSGGAPKSGKVTISWYWGSCHGTGSFVVYHFSEEREILKRLPEMLRARKEDEPIVDERWVQHQ